jgi:hypothetical protein
MGHESRPETPEERKHREAGQVTEWVNKYGPRAKERHEAEQATAWVKEHGGEAERRKTRAEREYWEHFMRSEGATALRDSLHRAEAMGLAEEAAKLKEQYDAWMKSASEGFTSRKEKLFKEVESALQALRDEVHHEEGEWKHDTSYVSGLDEAAFRYLSLVMDKPILLSDDLETDYEVEPNIRFITLEVQDDTTWVILREDGVVEYLTDEKIARVRPYQPERNQPGV